MGTNSYSAESPTWDELDAIAKGKSAMDLAEEIWKLRRSNGSSRPSAETLMAAAVVLNAKDEGWDEAIEACMNLEPPLTNDEIAHIQNAVLGEGTVMLRCKFYQGEKPEILFKRSFDIQERKEGKP